MTPADIKESLAAGELVAIHVSDLRFVLKSVQPRPKYLVRGEVAYLAARWKTLNEAFPPEANDEPLTSN